MPELPAINPNRWFRRRMATLLSGLVALVPLSASAQQALVVRNQDIRLTLQAGATEPRVLHMAGSTGKEWDGATPMALVDRVTVDGKELTLHWHLNLAASHREVGSTSLVYDTDNPDLRLSWEWVARSAHGPLEHEIRIENRGNRAVTLPLQDSFRFSWKVRPALPLQVLWIDKGAGKAPPVGTHTEDVIDGYRWLGESSTFAHPRPGEPREIIPYFLVRSPGENSPGWYLGVEFSGRIAMGIERHGDVLEGKAGLNPEPGPFRTILPPGGSFATPRVFLGVTQGSTDDAGNALRRWVRDVLNDRRTVADPTYPMLTNNSWGSGMAIDAEQAHRMIDDSAELGFEMFHLDAGWFRGVGDWKPDPKKFPQGLATVADYAHRRGLKFGLWVDWAQAGNSTQPGAMSVTNAATRDWLITDPPLGWKPGEFKGVTIDIGLPAAQAWAAKEVDRIVRDYHLDMLEHDGYVIAQGCDHADHPHATCDPERVHRYVDEEFLWQDGPNSTDVSYHATRAYYAIYRALKIAHPGLLLEICNDGGRMVDFGSAAVGDYFSIVDTYDPLSNRQAFYDASHLLPPAMLETYVMHRPTPRIENFRYMLRSGMMGWFTLMLDSTRWSPAQHDVAQEELRLYKADLRPLIRSADLYHVGPRPDGRHWDGTEYVDTVRGKGVLYAFHGSDGSDKEHTFLLRGLDPARHYQLHFHDGSAHDAVRTGSELMEDGLTVHLPLADSSELVFLEARD
jgi:Melibiase/Glycosyl hydrolase family 36 C-terminal domain